MQLKQTFDFSSFTVLLCTPSEFARALVADMCRAMRFKLVIAKQDYDGAWDGFANNAVDIVFGDVAPEDGCRLLKDMRDTAKSRNPQIPFIATSLASSPSCIMRARDCGATEFLRFPLSAETLIERVVHVVEHPRIFVKAPTYTGPDRRRKHAPPPNGVERRTQSPNDPIEAPAPGGAEQESWSVQA